MVVVLLTGACSLCTDWWGGGGLTAQKSHLMSPTAKRNDENKTIACNDNDTIQSKRFILKGEKNKKQNKLQATNERKNKRKMIQKHKRKKKKSVLKQLPLLK